MKYKNLYMVKQFEAATHINPRIKVVVTALDEFMLENYGKDIMITCVFRDSGDADVHAWGRGVDVRTSGFTEKQCTTARNHINELFPYNDGEHFTCIYGDNDSKGKHNDHFHIQTRSILL